VECGGKRSATPLLDGGGAPGNSAVAAAALPARSTGWQPRYCSLDLP